MLTKEMVIEKLKEVKDPELDVDVYTLGLIYDISIENGEVVVLMTLTTPFCPYGNEIVEQVEEKIYELKPNDVNVEITFEPPWEAPKGLREILGV
jgi:metal-sulfur cluster biosynthetic enzyme